MIKYAVFPGWVRSATDGGIQYIGPAQLRDLYGVPSHECVTLDIHTPAEHLAVAHLIPLRPRESGNYSLPTPPKPRSPTMNKRTIALILNEQIQVLSATYDGVDKNPKHYTFVTMPDWLPTDIEPGTRIVAQTKSTEAFAIVRFVKWLDITHLDPDDENIEYKFALGILPPEFEERRTAAEEYVNTAIKQVQHSRVATMRASIRNQLALEVKADATLPTGKLGFSLDKESE